MGRRGRKSTVHGVLVVDKPSGPTSHDVVAWARRVFRTSQVGHAGTLDPMATGVLVLCIGEGTKLVPYLTADQKAYETEVRLGVGTDSLDKEGDVVATRDVPVLDAATIEAALEQFRGRFMQRVPTISAVKVDGERLYKKARRGEEVQAPEREVYVHELQLTAHADASLQLSVAADKGFYVRSLGRDVAEALGTVGHLTALRRTRSGAFTLDQALEGHVLESAKADPDSEVAAEVRGRLLPLVSAWPGEARHVLNDRGVEDARQGRPIREDGLVTGALPEDEAPHVLVDGEGQMVAIARVEKGAVRVVRGIRT